MQLSPKLKNAWNYLCDKCDHAGIWDVNVALMSLQIGEQYTLDELVDGLGDRVGLIAANKLMLQDFVAFQYGTLNPANRVHQSVICRLEGFKNKPLVEKKKPLAEPLEGAKDKDKDKDKERIKEEERAISKLSIVDCCLTWKDTLSFFRINREILPHEQTDIARAIQRYGAQAVDSALYGARKEAKADGYDPASHISIKRVLDPSKFDKFLNLGMAAKFVPQIRPEVQRAKEQLEAEVDDAPHADPAKVAQLMRGLGFNSMPVGA